jgi:hypothetical protein
VFVWLFTASAASRAKGAKIWVGRKRVACVVRGCAAIDHAVVTAAIIIMVLLGIAGLIGGGIIVLVASRRAPNGFEDQEGFHVGEVPPSSREK